MQKYYKLKYKNELEIKGKKVAMADTPGIANV